MSKRRQAGERVYLVPGAGFAGDSNRFLVEILDDDQDYPCILDCGDDECREWIDVAIVEPKVYEGEPVRHGKGCLSHVSECQMLDEPYTPTNEGER